VGVALANFAVERPAGSPSLTAAAHRDVMRTVARLAVGATARENDRMKNVLDDILTLSVAERMQLVEDIWDSIAATPEAVPVTDAQRKELAKRKRAHQRNPAAAKPWK